MKHLVLVLSLAPLALAACAQTPEDAGLEALEKALEGTRTQASRHGAGAELPPLAEAGPHRSVINMSLTLGEGSGYRRIAIDRIIDRGAGGAYRIEDRRIWTDPALPVRGYDEGRDILYDGEGLYIRRLGAPWAKRETVGGHPERLLSQAYAMSGELARAFDHVIDWGPSSAPVPRFDGHLITAAEATLRSGAPPPKPATGSIESDRQHERAWPLWMGATHKVSSVSGTMARLEDTQHWLQGHLELSGTATVEGQSHPFTLSYTAKVSHRASATFEAPKDAMPATRPRTWRMIEDVLGDDLRAVYRP